MERVYIHCYSTEFWYYFPFDRLELHFRSDIHADTHTHALTHKRTLAHTIFLIICLNSPTHLNVFSIFPCRVASVVLLQILTYTGVITKVKVEYNWVSCETIDFMNNLCACSANVRQREQDSIQSLENNHKVHLNCCHWP